MPHVQPASFDFGPYRAKLSEFSGTEFHDFTLQLTLKPAYAAWLEAHPSQAEPQRAMLQTGLNRIANAWQDAYYAAIEKHFDHYAEINKSAIAKMLHEKAGKPAKPEFVDHYYQKLRGEKKLTEGFFTNEIAATETPRLKMSMRHHFHDYKLKIDSAGIILNRPISRDIVMTDLTAMLRGLETGLQSRFPGKYLPAEDMGEKPTANHYKSLAVAFRGIGPLQGLGRIL